ncbi:MAG TPA: flippase-like domain-containing protein [Rhodanobacteraceae bacterium]|jgi:uncharacterized protein (TIRG00374 family)|nr:flippase-like domain-containing protein [Rhodanobacteraceae bacterium]
MKRSWLWLLCGAAVAAGAGVPLALGGREALSTLFTVPLGAVVALAGLSLASALARAVKLRLLAMRLGHHISVPRALITAFASDAAFQATPAGAGGYPATIVLLRRGGVPASAGVAMCAADQALDSALFAVALPLFCLLDLGDAVPAAWHSFAWLPAVVILAVAVSIAIAYRFRSVWLTPLRALALRVRWLRERRERVRAFCARVVADFARLRNGSRIVTCTLVLAVAAQWIARYAALWLAMIVLGHPLPFGLVFVAQSVALHAAQWTGMPGGVGAGDVALAAGLSPWAPLVVLGPALLLWRLATYHLVLLAGAIAFACDRRPIASAAIAAADA